MTDCGAEARIVAGIHRRRMMNIRPLESPVIVETANGDVTCHEQGDLIHAGLYLKGVII